MYDAVVYDGVPAALEALGSAGCRLFVATSKAHHYARPILEHFDLAGHFAGIHAPSSTAPTTTREISIAHIIAQHGVAPESAIMIGDREFDVLAAARNGIRTVGVTWGYGGTKELEGAGAAALCDTPLDLASTIQALMGAKAVNAPRFPSAEPPAACRWRFQVDHNARLAGGLGFAALLRTT